MFITSITSVILATLLVRQASAAKNPSTSTAMGKGASNLPVARATFPSFGINQDISGSLEFHDLLSSSVEIISTAQSGLRNFPAGEGPFLYHIHVNPIPSENGTCTDAGPHLDPNNVGEMPPCNPATPAVCQYGDLAGKYGRIQQDPFVLDVTDGFISFDPSNKGYFLGRSVVVHSSNGTRIACANIEMPATANQNSTNSSSVVSNPAVSSTIPPRSSGTAEATATKSTTATLGSIQPSAGNKQNVASTFGLVILALGMGVVLH